MPVQPHDLVGLVHEKVVRKLLPQGKLFLIHNGRDIIRINDGCPTSAAAAAAAAALGEERFALGHFSLSLLSPTLSLEECLCLWCFLCALSSLRA